MDWTSLVEEYYRPITAYCVQFLGSSAEGQDAAQESFEKAARSLYQLKDPSVAKSWLYTIARNVCIDRQRWWKRTVKLLASRDIQTSTQPDTALSLTLRKLIVELPIRQREVFILRHLHGCSTDEVAQMLGINGGSVKSHLSRAINKLKEGLERE